MSGVVATSSGRGGPLFTFNPPPPQEKCKLIQRQLILLHYANKCQRTEARSTNAHQQPCTHPHCSALKNVLHHMTICNAGNSCQEPHCVSSRQILTHWNNCKSQTCPVCVPLKVNHMNQNASLKDSYNLERQTTQTSGDTAATGIMSPNMENMVPTQQNFGSYTSMISPMARAQLQPSWMLVSQQQSVGCQFPFSMRTSSASGQSIFRFTGTQNQRMSNPDKALAPLLPPWHSTLNQSVQQTRSDQSVFRFTAEPSKHAVSNPIYALPQLLPVGIKGSNQSALQMVVPQSVVNVSVPSFSSATSATPKSVVNSSVSISAADADISKPWQKDISLHVRSHLVHKLVKTVLLYNRELSMVEEHKREQLVAYARETESGYFEAASCRENYYYKMAEEIYKITKYFDERRSRLTATTETGESTAQQLRAPQNAAISGGDRQQSTAQSLQENQPLTNAAGGQPSYS